MSIAIFAETLQEVKEIKQFFQVSWRDSSDFMPLLPCVIIVRESLTWAYPDEWPENVTWKVYQRQIKLDRIWNIK